MSESRHFRTTADLSNLAAIRRFVQEVALAGDGDPKAVADMVLAVNEAVTNVILHGYRAQPGIVDVEVAYCQDALVVCLRDQAAPFDPTRALQSTNMLPLRQPQLGGMGIAMMHRLTDVMVYRSGADGGNELTLVKKGVRA